MPSVCWYKATKLEEKEACILAEFHSLRYLTLGRVAAKNLEIPMAMQARKLGTYEVKGALMAKEHLFNLEHLMIHVTRFPFLVILVSLATFQLSFSESIDFWPGLVTTFVTHRL